jgi:DNA (cytosine-5)-methyltransferase 1
MGGKSAGSVTQQDAEGGLLVTHSLKARFDGSEDGTGRGTPLTVIPINTQIVTRSNAMGERTGLGIGKDGDPAFTLQAGHEHGIAVTGISPTLFKVRCGCDGGGKGYLGSEDQAFTVATNQDQDLFHAGSVRRLTPRECERLQGFPDDYTLIPYRGKPACDGPRYKALGNSMAVPVIRWIGERIQMVDSLKQAE